MPAAPIDPKVYRLVVPEKSELLAGLIYLPLHMFIVGWLLSELLWALGVEASLTGLNLLYMLTGTVFLAITMRRHLQESFVRFLHFGLSNLWVMPAGYAIRFALSIPVVILVTLLIPDISSPNQDAVQEIIYQDFLASIVMAVVLAPFVEEVLFRSVLFAPIRKVSRFGAYFVSTLLFAFLHISFFLFFAPSVNLLLVMLLYVPAGIALCWAYEKSGSVWTAIFLHALMNLIAILLSFVLPELDPELLFAMFRRVV